MDFKPLEAEIKKLVLEYQKHLQEDDIINPPKTYRTQGKLAAFQMALHKGSPLYSETEEHNMSLWLETEKFNLSGITKDGAEPTEPSRLYHRQGTIEGILLIIKLKENQERKEKEYKQLKSELDKNEVEIKSSDWREIPVQYSGWCLVCEKRIKKGETALWAKDVGIKHTDEYHEGQEKIWKQIAEDEMRDQGWHDDLQESYEDDYGYDMDNTDGDTALAGQDQEFSDESYWKSTG